jgi:hypothetical protein
VVELIGVIRQSSTGEDSISEIIQKDGILGWAERNGNKQVPGSAGRGRTR